MSVSKIDSAMALDYFVACDVRFLGIRCRPFKMLRLRSQSRSASRQSLIFRSWVMASPSLLELLCRRRERVRTNPDIME